MKSKVGAVISFRVVVSVLPLVVLTGFAGSWAKPASQPCIATPSGALLFSSMPWRADIHVGFTDISSEATVRVQLVDQPDLADFVVTDDSVANVPDPSETDACEDAPSRIVTIDSHAQSGEPVIFLTSGAQDLASFGGRADYRIFVQSTTWNAREAAAMIVAAHGRPASADAS